MYCRYETGCGEEILSVQGTIRPYDFRNFTEIEKIFKAQVKAKVSVDMDGYDNTKNT